MTSGQHSFYHSTSWAKEGTNRVNYRIQVHGFASLEEVMNEVISRGHDYSMGDLQFSGQLAWEGDATKEAINKRDQAKAENALRTEKWERETLARLIAKYKS